MVIILSDNNIIVGLHCEVEKNSWMVPVYHQPSDKLIFFVCHKHNMIEKSKMSTPIEFNCVPNTVYELVVYLSWSTGTNGKDENYQCYQC